MTVEELKTVLLNKEFPNKVNISQDQVVTDVNKFLDVQFLECEAWKKDIKKCPAYVRLIKFYEALKKVN